MPDLYVVFEGPDGSGKTSISKLVTLKLNKMGVNALYVSEPHNKELARLAEDPELTDVERAYVYYIDRLAMFKKVAETSNPEILVGDRSFISSMVYQSLSGKITPERILKINRLVPKPDLVVYMDTPIDVIRARIPKEEREKLTEDYLTTLKKQYEKVLRIISDDAGSEVYHVTNISSKQVVSIVVVKKIMSKLGVNEEDVERMLDGEISWKDLTAMADGDDIW